MKRLIDFYPELLIEVLAPVKPSRNPDIDALMKQFKEIQERNEEEKHEYS